MPHQIDWLFVGVWAGMLLFTLTIWFLILYGVGIL